MGSTFWAVLYFRLPKRINVLPILTKYLIQYRRVCIPHIGTFEIVQQSPQLRVADQMMTAPLFRTSFSSLNAVPEHQFSCMELDPAQEAQYKSELFSFGQHLRQKIQQEPFQWNGFGTLRVNANELVFDPELIVLDSL